MGTGMLDSFRRRWEHVHAMTTAFVEAVPDAHWDAKPHPGFAPFSKQLRHVVCVRGVYNHGLRDGKLDFAAKHKHHEGGLGRSELSAALERKNVELLALLGELPVGQSELDAPRIDLFGKRISTFDCLYGYVQHEAIHHGQWSLYAAAAGYQPPRLWRLQWGLGAGEV